VLDVGVLSFSLLHFPLFGRVVFPSDEDVIQECSQGCEGTHYVTSKSSQQRRHFHTGE
jgi:hypothetical protein